MTRALAAAIGGALLMWLPALPAYAQAAAPAAPPASQDYVFPAGTALLLFYVAPNRTADFEDVAAHIAQALDASVDPVRRQQARSWRMFRSGDPVRGAVVYVFLLDPAVPGADYDPVRILSESLPADVQPLYQKLKAAVIRVERMSLVKLR